MSKHYWYIFSNLYGLLRKPEFYPFSSICVAYSILTQIDKKWFFFQNNTLPKMDIEQIVHHREFRAFGNSWNYGVNFEFLLRKSRFPMWMKTTNMALSHEFWCWKGCSYKTNNNRWEGWLIYDLFRLVKHGSTLQPNTVAKDELLCLKNAGTQISMFFTSNE